jgi:hypothetical protein
VDRSSLFQKAPQSLDKPSRGRTHDLIWKAAEKAGVGLPNNFGRNTFISMHVEKHKRKGYTALMADTSEATIDKDYLDMVKLKLEEMPFILAITERHPSKWARRLE